MPKLRPFIGPVQLKCVNFGVDTLIVNFKFAGDDGKPNGDTLPESVAAQLDVWQAAARKEHEPVATPWHYRDKTIFIRPHGSGVFSWLLFTEDVTLSMSYGSMKGSVFCQARFASHLLWAIGPEHALIDMQETLWNMTEEKTPDGETRGKATYAQASEVHICADIQGWYDFYDGSLAWQDGFVSRVVTVRARPDDLPTEREQEGGMSPNEIKKLNEHILTQAEESSVLPVVTTAHRRIATLDFGSHGSEIMGQIYNKSAEIKKSKKFFFEPLWRANGHDGLSEIDRIEIRVKRKALASFDLNDAFEVLSRITDLWDYATQEWLRYVDLDATQDTNKSRLPAHCVWSVVQTAYPTNEDTGLLDEQGQQDVRTNMLLHTEPLQLLGQAATIAAEQDETLDERIFITDEELSQLDARIPSSLARCTLGVAFLSNLVEGQKQAAITNEYDTMVKSFEDAPLEVTQEVASDMLAQLPTSRVKDLIDMLSPEPFYALRGPLVKREKRMAKKDTCIAGLSGYLTSLTALSYYDTGEYNPATGRPSGFLPSLLASLPIILQEVSNYNKKKGRNFAEEVHKKRLKYGFTTAQHLEMERKQHGVSLKKEDVDIWRSKEDIASWLDELAFITRQSDEMAQLIRQLKNYLDDDDASPDAA